MLTPLIAMVLATETVPTPSVSVPALIVVEPVQLFAPLRFQVPAPSLVKLPLPRLTAPVTLEVPPVTPMVRSVFTPVIPLAWVRVQVLFSELMREELAKVIEPAKFLSPPRLRNAPSLDTPVPFRISASAPMLPLVAVSCKDAPAETVVPPAVVPKAVALLTIKMPPDTKVAPA